MIKKSILIILLFVSFQTFGQQKTGSLIFRTYPVIGDLYVKIGDTLNTKPKISLPIGTHEITLWAPDYQPLDTTVTIFADSAVYMRKVLSQTKEFSKYRREVKNYKKNVVIPKIIYFTTSGVLTASSVISYLSARNKLKRTEEALSNYEISEIYSVDRSKEVYEDERKKYNKSKNVFYSVSAATAISWGVTLWQLRRLKKRHPKPVYQSAAPYFDISIVPSPSFQTSEQKNDFLFTFKIDF